MTLSHLKITIKGVLYALFPSAVLTVGQNANGDPVPILVGPDGGLAISAGAPPGFTEVRSTALESSHVLKASAGTLKHISINNTSGSTQFYLLMNSATVPADGAVTLLYPPIPVAAGTLAVIEFATPLVASTGIAICNGANNSFTKAVGGSDSIYYAQVI